MVDNNKLIDISIVPEPVKIVLKEGIFSLNDAAIILRNDNSEKETEYLQNLLREEYSLNLKIENSSKAKFPSRITLKIEKNLNNLNDEGYILSIAQNCIELRSSTTTGMFYGIQTLRQLLPIGLDNTLEISIPCLEIEDYPRFSWRGFMLDEARHFFGKQVVKKIINVMAYLKMNVFHWHLSEDQGWRVEIKKYPKLTEIGSRRKGTIKGRNFKETRETQEIDKVPVSGFYTQDDLIDIVNYAAENHITIVPEIDVPGHTRSILASYPNLSCNGGPFEVSTRFGIHKDVLCIGKDQTMEFIKDIFKEIIDIFPSEFIHIGGDEVPTNRWKKCSDCQALMKNEGLECEEHLQAYFTDQVVNFLTSNGRRVIGWNEILNDRLKKNVVCQYWISTGFKTVLEHITKGRDVVMSEMRAVYLDYPHNLIILKNTYKYNPIPDTLDERFHKHILGIETCLWTEFVKNEERLGFQAFPRLIAVAETGWTPLEKKDYGSFKNRLEPILQWLDNNKINHASWDEFDI